MLHSRDSLEDSNGSEGTQVQSSYDSPLSGDHTSEKAEGGLNLEELFVLCTNFSNRVLALETSKDAQAAQILKLKDQIKKLKRKCNPSISHHKAWLKRVKRLSIKKRLGMKESVSKQGRKNSKPEPTLDAFDDLDADGRDYMETEDVVKEGRQSNETEELNKGSGEKGGNVDTARQEDSVVEPKTPPTTTNIEDSSRPVRSILTLKPLPTIDPKDKGKTVLEEPEPAKKMTKSDFDAAQIARDAEIARQLQVDLQAEVERERQREEEESKAAIAETYDEVQAGINADALFAAKLQQEEREEYTIEERAKVIDDFKPIDSDDAVKDFKEAASVNKQEVLKGPNSTKVEVKKKGHEESIRKRPGRRLKMKATKKSKRQKTDADLEEEDQLKAFLKIVPDEEGIIDYDVLEKRFPIINWESKFYDFDRHGAECIYYRIFRSDGSSRWIKTFSEMVTRFDRLDLVELYNLNQERWNLKSWDLYENCGVHTLILEDGTEIHMLAERKYPLIKETLKRILSLRLVAGTASEDAYTLLRFIQKQIDDMEAMMEVRRIFKCWLYNHTTNGHQFTMSNRHQELASLEQTASGKDFSNPLMVNSLPKTIWFSTHHALQ
ncbi:hypothetical protein Tco_0744371 [Tanacetum coccineum]